MTPELRIAVQMEIGQGCRRHTGIFAGIHDYARRHANWRLIIDEWVDHSLPGRGTKESPYDGLIGPANIELDREQLRHASDGVCNSEFKLTSVQEERFMQRLITSPGCLA